ncbi:MAG: TPM domain-containing protein [Ignavibacteriae bacterium]|nr:TPM domain-containing protein [Ignavibacteriota bacterium]
MTNIILMIKYLFTLLLLLSVLKLSFAQSEKSLINNPPKLSEYITDETGTLKPDEITSLKSKLRKFYDSTSTQIVVYLIPSLNGEPVEMVANAIYHANGIGGKGKDNGALLLISKGDRKIRIEVGYGLEGVLTDAMSKQIIQKDISPSLKSDNYYKGIDNAVVSIIALSKGEYTKDNTLKTSDGGGVILVILAILIPFVLFIFILIMVLRKRAISSAGGGFYSNTNYYSGSNSDNSTSGSSSDSSSGSDSGFSGGGGDSGGGGASGDY